jgi:hypothetical protein
VLVIAGVEVTAVLVAAGAIVFCGVVETVFGSDVRTMVVGGGVWTGGGAEGDAHPATKIAATSKNIIVIIRALFPFI